ncbi:MarR family winged helix-turn-helix transcriptional regulator [Actinomadura rubrisoli]|uniref:MarR family transcriptional regulator n=1 Tax=Actinomadura rubrisoli TaxID=2530368 RepID=A0A4R5C3L3_9ACTN|nr:MarR family transcriptional regulator [Actinomadura rubrisoli]TDD92500.1 MarR family transcriptional regulator [Actinomadura rubrisoli]
MSALPIEQRLGHHLKRVEQELIAAKTVALRPYGLNVPQYTVLLVLAHEPGLSGAALARRCLVTPQTMSSVLTTLESRRLVERTPHPIHTHILEVRLTRKAKSVLAEADAEAVKVELRLSAKFKPQEADQLIEYLGRCSGVLTEVAAGPKKAR